MTNFPNLKPHLGKKTGKKLPLPPISKPKKELLAEMTAIIDSATKLRDEYEKNSTHQYSMV
jgi:hypothetical protein